MKTSEFEVMSQYVMSSVNKPTKAEVDNAEYIVKKAIDISSRTILPLMEVIEAFIGAIKYAREDVMLPTAELNISRYVMVYMLIKEGRNLKLRSYNIVREIRDKGAFEHAFLGKAIQDKDAIKEVVDGYCRGTNTDKKDIIAVYWGKVREIICNE